MSEERPPVREYATGDRVRVDIPDETHPDHERYHGKHGRVVATLPAAGPDGGGGRERRFRVEFDGGGYADFERFFLRPPIVR